jgi:aminoglycoside phosphotransferase (APT) family kinase protein
MPSWNGRIIKSDFYLKNKGGYMDITALDISELKNKIHVTPILKGFSQEKKWKVELEDGKKYFVKAGNIQTAEQRKKELYYVQHFEKLGVPVPKLVAFYEFSERCVEISEFIEGEDGPDALPKMTVMQQYEVGSKAGEVLKIIHSLHKEKPEETWEQYRLGKYERYMERYNQLGIELVSLDVVTEFIDRHKHLLQNRPVVFLHDDYHPENLMFASNQFRGVLDFGRFEWGDPYHDFYKMALFTRNVSIPFAVGQIHGYFQGEPPVEFWEHYSLYAALIFVSDIVWSYHNTPYLLEETKKRLTTILEDHDQFQSYKPRWHTEYTKS